MNFSGSASVPRRQPRKKVPRNMPRETVSNMGHPLVKLVLGNYRQDRP